MYTLTSPKPSIFTVREDQGAYICPWSGQFLVGTYLAGYAMPLCTDLLKDVEKVLKVLVRCNYHVLWR
jgi:hypothetical protein